MAITNERLTEIAKEEAEKLGMDLDAGSFPEVLTAPEATEDEWRKRVVEILRSHQEK
jgi:hypothetical protein